MNWHLFDGWCHSRRWRGTAAIGDSYPVTLTAAQKRLPKSGIHWAWVIAAVSFVAILGAAAFRSVPGVMMNPLHHEFGWSHGVVGLAMSVNMTLFGVTAPFAAALMDRFGVRPVLSSARSAEPWRRGLMQLLTVPAADLPPRIGLRL